MPKMVYEFRDAFESEVISINKTNIYTDLAQDEFKIKSKKVHNIFLTNFIFLLFYTPLVVFPESNAHPLGIMLLTVHFVAFFFLTSFRVDIILEKDSVEIKSFNALGFINGRHTYPKNVIFEYRTSSVNGTRNYALEVNRKLTINLPTGNRAANHALFSYLKRHVDFRIRKVNNN